MSPTQDPNTLGQQFQQMNLGPQPVQVTPQLQQAAPAQQNQLYPSDLISQPFQVAELDLPPPPINLPPNTSVTPSPYANCPPKYIRSTLNAVPTTANQLARPLRSPPQRADARARSGSSRSSSRWAPRAPTRS